MYVHMYIHKYVQKYWTGGIKDFSKGGGTKEGGIILKGGINTLCKLCTESHKLFCEKAFPCREIRILSQTFLHF